MQRGGTCLIHPPPPPPPPLVISATGGLAKEPTVFYKRLASMLASKWDSSTLCWLRCRLTFSLLRSAIQSIRGARSSRGNAAKVPTAVDLSQTNVSSSRRVQALKRKIMRVTYNNAEISERDTEFLECWEISRMRKQCVPGPSRKEATPELNKMASRTRLSLRKVTR